MRRLGVVGVARQYSLDQLDGIAQPWLRRLVRLPIIPRQGVHRRFSGEQGNVVVGGMRGGGGQHCIGISCVEGGAVGFGLERVALEHCVGERSFGGGRLGRQPLRIFGGGECAGVGVGFHGRVDVGAARHRLAPPAHRASGIEPLRLAEGGDGTGVVEAVSEAKAAGEVTLGFCIACGDREVDFAETALERCDGIAGLDSDDRCRQSEPCPHRLAAARTAAQAGEAGRRVEKGQLFR